MMGTLATVLAGKKIPTFGDRYRADVEGDVEDVAGVLRITKIRVRYTLKVPPGKTGGFGCRQALAAVPAVARRAEDCSGPHSVGWLLRARKDDRETGVVKDEEPPVQDSISVRRVQRAKGVGHRGVRE